MLKQHLYDWTPEWPDPEMITPKTPNVHIMTIIFLGKVYRRS